VRGAMASPVREAAVSPVREAAVSPVPSRDRALGVSRGNATSAVLRRDHLVDLGVDRRGRGRVGRVAGDRLGSPATSVLRDLLDHRSPKTWTSRISILLS
jgi:hypothetical protein